jgi:hypothetical protein
MATTVKRLHQFINDLLVANYRAQQQHAGMLTDLEIEEAIFEFFPRVRVEGIEVYRAYFNRRQNGFGLEEATTDLRPAYEPIGV